MTELHADHGKAFRDPPIESRPLAWWHWMNGNISEEGIVKDLEWMARVGLGGVQNFDAALATPRIVENRLAYMTPQWRQAFRLAVERAAALDLEFGIAGSPGWSETGGPWVPPQDGMKKLVWSETSVRGGAPCDLVLPMPPRSKGPYQDAVFVPHVIASEPALAIDDFYGDAHVLAYRVSDAGALHPATVRDSGAVVADPSALFDGTYRTALEIERGTKDQPGFLDLSFDQPVVARSLRIAVEANGRIYRRTDIATELLASADGVHWQSLVTCQIMRGIPSTVSFPEAAARHFRIVFHPADPENPRAEYSRAPGAIVPAAFPSNESRIAVREVCLMKEARVDQCELKAGYAIAHDYYALERDLPDSDPVMCDDVIDLTHLMDANGRLRWDPPAGDWRILRLGYSLTGTLNHPATREATGLEVDKYDADAVGRYIERYLANFRDVLGPELMGAKGLRSIIVDSIETGLANWTPRLVAHFKRLRGYDPTPWLPAVTGVVIQSRADSDRFLYDFRRTLADLLATEHYRTVANVARGQGLIVYGEATEVSRPVLGDDMAMRRHTDVPMSAMWTFHPDARPRATLLADIKGAASVANVHGQNLAAAESLTSAYSPWAFAPWDLKLAIDLEFAMGINRPVLHSSVHQPSDDHVPGLSLSVFGQYFNRHDTWAEMAGPWIDYIARCSHLLRIGRFHADVAYFYGEEAPLTALFEREFAPDAPKTTGFDFVNAEALIELLDVDGDCLITPSGCRYRALYLGGASDRMTLPVLDRIEQLVRAGATVVGKAPQCSPGLHDDSQTFHTAVSRLWPGQRVTHLGLGRVFAGDGIDSVLREIGVAADVADEDGNAISDLLFNHRQQSGEHLYFLSNRRDDDRAVRIRFGVASARVQAWDPATGTIEDLPFTVTGGATLVDWAFPARGSIFLVLGAHGDAAVPVRRERTEGWGQHLGGEWHVTFQSGRGAPPEAMLAEGSLCSHDDPGIRYFSGVASYARAIQVTAGQLTSGLTLDLGAVGDIAEVHVNGCLAGTVWKAPWSLNIGQFVHEGTNMLEIKVANVWVNRLIGDKQPGMQPVAVTPTLTYHPDAPLRPSGLIGPVRLVSNAAGD